jgi:hypothetical protein
LCHQGTDVDGEPAITGGYEVASGYRVNTDELEAVVTKLRNLQKNLSETASSAQYNTVLQPSDVGWDFPEAHDLYTAHSTMKNSLERLIKNLEQMIDDFSGKTKVVTNSYKENEYQLQSGFGGGQSTPRL